MVDKEGKRKGEGTAAGMAITWDVAGRSSEDVMGDHGWLWAAGSCSLQDHPDGHVTCRHPSRSIQKFLFQRNGKMTALSVKNSFMFSLEQCCTTTSRAFV